MIASPLLVASLAISFAAYPVYAHGIYSKTARPTRPTWLMILVSDLLLFAFMLAEARWDWLLLGFTAGNIWVLMLMAFGDIRQARGTLGRERLTTRDVAALAVFGRDPWTSKDIYSVAVALGALGLWAVTGSGVVAICFSLLGKIAAAVPMLINLYREPTRELILPWVLWTVGGALYVASIPAAEWSFTALAAPVMFLVLETCVVLLLLRRFNGAAHPAAA